ncbi:MAG: GDP-mannose 4,6-dehydratase, partial [Burkholderiales bacterium]|nr:GDP-mannose 4,6-dehydratase [Burkholderiales bacterium]
MNKTLLVTGGAGFIGSWFVDKRVEQEDLVVTLDKLTYSGNMANLSSVLDEENHIFIQGDIRDRDLVEEILRKYEPDFLVNFAAETHVDRSILASSPFIETNVVGVDNLLSCLLQRRNSSGEGKTCKFIQISTDEVYGPSTSSSRSFSEEAPLNPTNPYAASKASADLLVQAYGKTHGLPYLIVRCSNNYGPRQFPEKLIPHFVKNALEGGDLPIYGDGENLRNWLYVGDCCEAISLLIDTNTAHSVYNIAGKEEFSNSKVAEAICFFLDELYANNEEESYIHSLKYVKARHGLEY